MHTFMRSRIRRAAAFACAAALWTAFPRAQRAVPTPESVIGWTACADYKLATYEQVTDYFRSLAAASSRLQMLDIGKTVEGRTQVLAVISSEQNLKNLARHKQVARSLALNRQSDGGPLSDDRARELADAGKAVVWIDFGLHATEVAPAQAAPLLAWKLVSDETEEAREIRDNVIVVLVPNMNPDGGTLVADWYMKNAGKPWEMSIPSLFQRYAGFDNNRDWFMFTQPESRNVAKQLYEEFFPQVVYDHHQAAPYPARIFVPPFADPSNFNIPPLVMRGVNTVGDAITRRLEEEGKVGAISRVEFDSWWNGGMRTAPYFHNMIGILTETSHASPKPADNDPARFPPRFGNGESTTEPSTYYPSPYKGGHWTLRNSCDYVISASMAVLDIGAKRRREWLYDSYQMARDAIAAGRHETYVIPAEQWDPNAAVRMVNILRLGGVEVERATTPVRVDHGMYPAGSFVIRGAQPFFPYIRDLLNPQVYPDRRLFPDGPPQPPYDITGWTLNMQMGVKVNKWTTDVVDGQTERVASDVVRAGSVREAAKAAYVLDPRTNETFIAVNRLLKKGDSVYRTTTAIDVPGGQWPAGSFLVAANRGTHEHVAETATALGLDAAALNRPPNGDVVRVNATRVAVYQAWGGNMDEGWMRWVLEQYEFPYTTVHNADVRDGNLRARFDVIVLPDARYLEMLHGLGRGTMPPELTGGLGPEGVHHLFDFVAAGGTLVAQDRACELPLAVFGLPSRNSAANLRNNEFYGPGALIRLSVDNSKPVAWGMPGEVAAFFANGPVLEVDPRAVRRQGSNDSARGEPASVDIVATYPAKDQLMSGWLLGARYLSGKVAVLQADVGKGHVVLLGFRPQHRGQTHATFKLLFNAIYLGTTEAADFAASRTEYVAR